MEKHQALSRLVRSHVERFIHETNISWPTFGQQVAEIFERLIAADTSSIHFPTHRDPYKQMRLRAQYLRRHLEDDEPPMDLLEALVMALPKERQNPLLLDLMARMGRMPIEIPRTDRTAEEVERFGTLLREMGEATQAMAPLLADGVIDSKDHPHALHAVRQLTELLAATASLRNQLLARLPELQAVPVAVERRAH